MDFSSLYSVREYEFSLINNLMVRRGAFYTGLVEEVSSEEKGLVNISPQEIGANVDNALLSFRDLYATGY